MRRRRVLSVPLAWCAGCVAEPPQAATSRICGGLGRGFHLGETLGRTLDDYTAIAQTGATLVRMGLRMDVDAGGDGYAFQPGAHQELLNQVGFARRTGLRIIPVLRPEPTPESRLWSDERLQTSLAHHWSGLARELAGRTEVAAFDLVNEPHPPGLTFAQKNARWADLAMRLAAAVRAQDADRCLIVEPSPGARPMGFETATPLPLANVAYSLHMYEPFEFTHQRVGDPRFTAVVDYPAVVPGQGRWDRERLRRELEPARSFGERHRWRIYVGEFGAARWAPGASRERYLRDLIGLFNEWGWSWTYHAWREWQGWDAEMGPGGAADSLRAIRNQTEPTFVALREGFAKDCGGAGGGA